MNDDYGNYLSNYVHATTLIMICSYVAQTSREREPWILFG
jgi:hypothetical protein